ncbi:unnamed protein product [Rotaria sp. Silwood2]|nr:unnamed protein product [Rotaria sp. Silwood2]
MPEKGSCTDISCDNEIKELYECHCCLRLVCFHHLSKHTEKVKENKQRLGNLRNELNTVVYTLKLNIEREQNVVEQAKKIFDEPSSSIDELKNIIEKINQTIVSNRLGEITVKVEPSLSETKYCSCSCKCNKENMDSNDDEYSTDINHDSMEAVSMDETTNSIEDQHVNEENKPKQKPYRRIFRKCPLTFNGAYGLTEANHSIEFCKQGKTRQFELYIHFINKHRLKNVYAQRLVRAVVERQDPRITKLFNKNENVINHFYKVPCPICCGQINSSEYNERNGVTVTCKPRFIILHQLKQHLQRDHKVSSLLANKLVDDIKENQTKNDSDSVLLVPSTSSK